MNLLTSLSTYFQDNVALYVLLIISVVLFVAAIVAAIVLFVLKKTGKCPCLCKKETPAENAEEIEEKGEL